MPTKEFYPFRSEEAKKEYLDFFKKRAMKWPVKYEEKRYATSFGDTYVRIAGPAKGAPLILMHGGGDNSSSWAPNIETLASEYRVYAVDLINGQNMSICKKPVENLNDILVWMDELLGVMGIEEKTNMLGMSYGAYLIARYTLSYPHKIKKAILMAPPNFAISNDIGFILRVLLMLLPIKYFTEHFFHWVFKDMYAREDQFSQETMRLFIDNAMMIRKCYALQKFINPKVFTKEELQSISAPLYFMIGENDKNYSAKKAISYLNEVAPHIKTTLFENVGHELPMLMAPAVNEKVMDFLRGK